jgi:glycogen operon protein
MGSRKTVNFICSHDGFTLRDLVSYRDKHNEANLEENRDGEGQNHSTNCGVEGPTQDPEIRKLRLRMQKNFLTTLMISRGIPMFPAGDERGRTQHGNNNAYCQDNELSWLDWTHDAEKTELITFTRELIQLRKSLPALRFKGLINDTSAEIAAGRVSWIGARNKDPNWGGDQAIGLRLSGKAEHLALPSDSEDVLIFFNASPKTVRFHIPDTEHCKWKLRLQTTQKRIHRSNLGTSILTQPHSVIVYSALNKKASTGNI